MKTKTNFISKALLFAAFILNFDSVSAQKTNKLTVHFKFNEYTLDSSSKSKIDSLLLNSIVQEVKIEAYCDSFGSNTYNDTLSLKRALEVKQYLILKKLDQALINIKTFGKRLPINNNANETERALNRRAEILFIFMNSNKVKSETVAKDTAVLDINNVKVGASIKLENLNFEGNRHVLLPKSMKTLQLLLNTLKTNPNLEIEIQGYICCQSGTGDGIDMDTGTNDLSVNRAKAIYEYLVENGIEASRLSYKGFGASNKIIEPELTEEDRITNRRVEIKIISK